MNKFRFDLKFQIQTSKILPVITHHDSACLLEMPYNLTIYCIVRKEAIPGIFCAKSEVIFPVFKYLYVRMVRLSVCFFFCNYFSYI